MSGRSLSILHITSEVAPYSQSGGLGDVTRDLPTQQRKVGLRSVVVSPLYACVDRTFLRREGLSQSVTVGGKTYDFHIWYSADKAHWFIDVPGLLDRENLYGDSLGDYPDNPLRFAVFSKAALHISDDFDLLHIHDWQTGLVGVYNQGRKPIVVSIHNLGYQGLCDFEWASQIDLPNDLLRFDGVEYYGKISLLKAGLVTAHQITTVSPTYAAEIQSEPGGQGLSGLFAHRSDSVSGVLNGLDYVDWNPKTDPCLTANFDVENLERRVLNRDALMSNLNLDAGVVFGVVSRAAHQKGLHLITEHMDELVHHGCRFVFLTDGEKDILRVVEGCAKRHAGKVSLIRQFSPTLARQIYGGVDYIAVPSLYEPCGLTQMMAMRYGAVPVVRATGGLADTVIEGKTGLCFKDVSSEQCRDTLLRGMELFERQTEFRNLQLRCMHERFSWERSEIAYGLIYQQLVKGHGEL